MKLTNAFTSNPFACLPNSRLIMAPLFDTPDSGAGAGGGGAASSSDGGGAGAGAGTGAGAGAGAGAAPFKLSDDALVDFGDGKPVKYGEGRQSRYMDKSSYERGVNFLTEMAKTMDRSRGQGNAGAGAAAGATARPGAGAAAAGAGAARTDPFADVENLAVMDGRTFAKFGRQLMQEGFGPIGQAMEQIGKRLAAAEQRLGQVGQVTGTMAETHQSAEFDTFLGKAIAGLPEIKGLGRIADDPAVRELAKDIYLSHDQANKELPAHFPKMLQDRIEAMFSYFQKSQQSAVAAAKAKQREFFNPARGQSQGTGKPAYKHQTGEELAQMFFDAQDGART